MMSSIGKGLTVDDLERHIRELKASGVLAGDSPVFYWNEYRYHPLEVVESAPMGLRPVLTGSGTKWADESQPGTAKALFLR